MKIKKLWMAGTDVRKNLYAWRTMGRVVGIVVLMTALIAAGILLGSLWNWPMQWVSVILWAGVTALGVWLSLRTGQRCLRDATVFLLTENDRLFVLNAADLNQGRNVLGYAAGTMKTQAFLNRLATDPYVPAGAKEILQVERIRERKDSYVLHCRMRTKGSPVFRWTCLLVKGLAEEDQLLFQLERRRDWQADLEPRVCRTPLYLAVSMVVLGLLVALCIMSHPAVGILAQAIYFPCLGGCFAVLFVFVYFLVRLQRGE